MLVIVLTGRYTVLGGMRAVAYNDAVQTFVLILGSASFDFLWPGEIGRMARITLLVWFRPLQLVEAPDSGRRTGNVGSGYGNECRWPVGGIGAQIVFFFGVFCKRLNAKGAL